MLRDPEPWDFGSARYLQSLGFKALATTSSGFAWSQGRADGAVDARPSAGTSCRNWRRPPMCLSTPISKTALRPIAAGVGESVRLAVETGIAGLSIEDSTARQGTPRTRPASAPLFELEAAVERVRAARRAIDAPAAIRCWSARAECFLVGLPDYRRDHRETQGLRTTPAPTACMRPGSAARAHPRASSRPSSQTRQLLVSGAGRRLRCAHIADLGVRRVSVGGALARAAWGGFMRAAREIAEHGLRRARQRGLRPDSRRAVQRSPKARLASARSPGPPGRHGAGGIIGRAPPQARIPGSMRPQPSAPPASGTMLP